MTTRKRNEWFDAEGSDEEEAYASEEESKGRTATGRAPKRRKTDSDSGTDDADEAGSVGESHKNTSSDLSKLLALKKSLPESRFNLAAFEADDDDDEDHGVHTAHRNQPAKLPHLLSSESVRSSRDAARKTGVVYLSRVPPFMKPSTLRNLLSPHGTLGRVFLTPEDASAARARASRGGNRKKSYADGWVEFLSKREAKSAAAMLNGRPIGGKKGGWYRDDVWTLKYLRGFKWADLTEQMGNERAEKANRVRMEVARATRENRMFVEGVERGKMLENMARRGQGKGEGHNDDEEDADEVADADGRDGAHDDGTDGRKQSLLPTGNGRHKSHFKQNEVRDKASRSKRDADPPDEVKRVLSQIF